VLPGNRFAITVDPQHPGPPGLLHALNPSQRESPEPVPMPPILLRADEVVVDGSGSTVGTGR